MTRSVGLLGVAITVAAALAGCSGADSSGQGEMAVQGTVSQALSVDNARAVAIGSDGRTFWAYLDARRDFTLMLPVGQSYRILIANERAGGGHVKIAHLVVQSGATPWLGANEPGTVDLGTLRLMSRHGDDDDDRDESDHHRHDGRCHEGPHHGDGDDGVCDDDHDEALEPTKDPGHRCDDHHHHGDSGKDHDGDGDDKSCTGDGDAGTPDAGGSTGGDAGTGGGIGAECLTNKDCAAGLTCVAGVCSVKI
jgi:hypothetical protein